MRFETHCHSHYSNIRVIDSINKPRDLILGAYKLGYSGIALTDHEALCGHIEWLELEKELKEQNLISKDFVCGLGNEIYLTDSREPNQKYWHFILIAKNTTGHRALRELSSGAWLNSYRHRGMERVPTLKNELAAIVEKYPNSLIATNACIGGELGAKVLQLVALEERQGSAEEIYQIKSEIDDFIRFCLSLFRDDFYIEIAPGLSPDQCKFNQRIKSIARAYHIKMIVATDAHYLTAEDREIHKAFLNSKEAEREIDAFYHDAHLMSDEEAYSNLKKYYTPEEFSDMCRNSLEIMSKIQGYELFHQPIIPEVTAPFIPKYDELRLRPYQNLYELRSSGNDQERYWLDCCLKGLAEKRLETDEYFRRLDLEAGIIRHIGDVLQNCLFCYFVTFQHYIDLFWECGSIVGPGRGSAGSFLSNYLLGITQLDPIVWKFPYFRFLNEDRVELPDIDIDIAPSKRPLVLKRMRQERGELNVVQVATFGTESTKAAIACAAKGYRSKECPNGIDVDTVQYMSSLVPVERGVVWSLSDCLEGNESKNRKPVQALVAQFEQYPGLKEIALGVEGLVCRRGQHASGVVLYNRTPYETAALMRSPNGDITTQYDLHRAEACGDTKFDFLVTDICDKISVCLDLLADANYFPNCNSKREIYNKYLHPSVLNLEDDRIWDALAAGTVQDVFQFNTEIGVQTAKAIAPRNPVEMTAANALLRLVAPEGQERPIERYIRFRKDISLWYDEMTRFGLTAEEQKTLEPYYLESFGVPHDQERLMLLVMDPNISHFTLAESNATRKILAKKQLKKIPEIKEKFISRCPNRLLGEYCWNTMMLVQMSYSFSMVHSTLYTFIGIQTLVLATQFPSIYWNTACLIVNSQSIQDDDEDDNNDEDSIDASTEDLEKENFDNDDDDDDEQEKTKKKKQKSINFGKIASAIGKIKTSGVSVIPPDINKSAFTFSPDIDNNAILYGLSGIVKVGEDLIKEIMAGRPYTSLIDFMTRIKANKPQMINLIKSGAFDRFGDRVELMHEYVNAISDTKKRITLQNTKTLIDFGLIPEDYDLEKRVYNFNKYLKKMKLGTTHYGLDEIAFNFYSSYFDIDKLESCDSTESGFKIKQVVWDIYYQNSMDKIRPYVQKNSAKLLAAVNSRLTQEMWNKYCLGNLSKWEMDSISFYHHAHELERLDCERYGISNFHDLPEEPEIEHLVPIKGKLVPILKLRRIAGTVLDRDKAKKTVTLLTTHGVVTVKIFGAVFAIYDKRISEIGMDGKKHVIRNSEFTRGNKLIICGVRDGDSFRAKKYKKTPYHLVEQIVSIDEQGKMQTQARMGEE